MRAGRPRSHLIWRENRCQILAGFLGPKGSVGILPALGDEDAGGTPALPFNMAREWALDFGRFPRANVLWG
jgi:hypothetical protein